IDAARVSVDSRVMSVRAVDSYRGDTEHALDDIRQWLAAGFRLVLLTQGHGSAERIAEMLAEHDLATRLVDDLTGDPAPRVVTVTTGRLDHGFVAARIGVVLLTEED